jgi:hypothetical protein
VYHSLCTAGWLVGDTVGAAPNCGFCARAFAGGLAVNRARLNPAVTKPAAGQCESVWSSRFSPVAVESGGAASDNTLTPKPAAGGAA